MRLADYILENLECILQEWEEFAATLVPAEQKADKILLRDHLKQMLEEIAHDLAQPQTALEKSEKSKGRSDSPPEDETAASIHGAERLALGFSLNDAMAEYRALRASVTRLWQESLKNEPIPLTAMGDLIRFNEAVDQSINESVTKYSFEKERQTRVLDTILSSSPDLSFTFDLDGKFAYANKSLTELLMLSSKEIVGKNHFDLNLPTAAELQREIQNVISTKKQFRGEMDYVTSAGQKMFFDYILVPTFNSDGEVDAVAGTARNVTDRKAIEDLNWQKANYDLLTGLPNRRLLADRLEQDLKHASRISAEVALLFIDLDHFKAANDSFGHDAGDILLRLSADRIRVCVRETDTVARLGGDEFTVILQGLGGSEYVERVAGKILKTLANSFDISGHSVNISSSIGIAIFPSDASTPEQLLKNADEAMYLAKAEGRNKFHFFSPQN
jgi:diguanylate cyclase (GGDEF)-like protein/PAS domain S-box-containing protein